MMEGGVHRGRWNGTMLLLVCMFIPTLTLALPSDKSDQQPCPEGDIYTDAEICCPKCSPGYRLVEECHAPGQRSNCTPCASGLFMDQMNYEYNCRSCRHCKSQRHEVEVSACTRFQNAICRCKDGYYKVVINKDTNECRKCKLCGENEEEKQKCTPDSNTDCECKKGYYRVKGKVKCEPCNNCTAECEHLCSPPSPKITKGPESDQGFLLNLLAGGTVAVVVLFALVVSITHVVTKWSTKKRLLGTSSQSSDISTDSCKVLIQGDTSNNNNLKVAPQSPVTEHEQLSNLPDCVPFEIKIPELIYTVLDLVPVLQVKQLVRSLGVRDTEIEQAELDHRSCREAHYQMLRVWAERGSRAGGMLHWPLLHDMLDELRKMHLGQAAEELETKYGIQ
ncbi:tumor necrosis factor receptor superfamily member 1A isoform X2 [Acanthopagrus latus]|uniref:tumor necrosis factor receptor superfamily member 1A isoform X2 n=1 Tax=Acanthopagrus latus TaxID=8177 RepID=UPI00187BE52C|nr:tumor necrosis factor receptor superfamily member 1A isoform X2 [Acanthopagrus latus]